ncbi:uncharacterized protein LDX57_004094 [Aspergillus melleus]|uniref:uncharacterized protein n=1 Tax=Aspergillus melleus TaxID=138277 RepID=UPI001E8EF0FF|nr:uncharacterized protein LDX57_004094 [Aspergillus melleus]KAH8426351.1 hypothetical protein LDX57_004094 [Aspergillus melleus]
MRLRTADDFPNLLYIAAIVSEIFRWRHPSPGGLHHASGEDDVYRGFWIPKDTAVVATHFALDTDETIFERPFDFDPDRWIPLLGSVGGLAPGLYVGRNSVTMAITRLLWGYAFEDGKRLDFPPWDLTQGIGVRPSPFKASFRVRDQKRQDIIKKAWIGAEKDTDVLLRQAGSSFTG